jgi:hypothetical protein
VISFVRLDVSDGVTLGGGVMVTVVVGRKVGVDVTIGESLLVREKDPFVAVGVMVRLCVGCSCEPEVDTVNVTVDDCVREGLVRVSVCVLEDSAEELGPLKDGVLW